MHLKQSTILSLITAAFCLATIVKGLPAQSKIIVTDEGQAKLMQEVNAGQKSNQLTLKEANKLRKDLAHVARKKAKMLAKTTGRKLSAADAAKLKSDINEISDNIHKLELEKGIKSR
jgi:hypothetical protein